MREIKFRAWNTDLKCMVDGQHLQYLLLSERNSGIAEAVVGWKQKSIDKAFEEYSHLIWLAYTGIKDKNGKEIYEGDILLDGEHKEVVKWEEGCFWCHGGGGSDFHFYEVIGNIYENPELVK